MRLRSADARLFSPGPRDSESARANEKSLLLGATVGAGAPEKALLPRLQLTRTGL